MKSSIAIFVVVLILGLYWSFWVPRDPMSVDQQSIRSESKEQDDTFRVYYLPFDGSTYVAVTEADAEHMYDISSLWGNEGRAMLLEILGRAEPASSYADLFVRLVVRSEGKTLFAVASDGSVCSDGKILQLSPQDVVVLRRTIAERLPPVDFAALFPESEEQAQVQQPLPAE